MKRYLISTLALFFLFTFAGFVSAEPSFNGPTGLIISPTADITTPESAWLGANYIDYSNSGVDSSLWSYTLTGGISEVFEIGVAGFYSSSASDGFGLNAKYALVLEGEETPGISIGLIYNDMSGDSVTNFYIVGTRYFQADDLNVDRAVGIHGGVGWLDSAWVNDEFNYWGGLDFNIADNMIAIAEYISTFGPTDNDVFTFGVRYFANETWSGQAGLVDGDMTIGASFIF